MKLKESAHLTPTVLRTPPSLRFASQCFYFEEDKQGFEQTSEEQEFLRAGLKTPDRVRKGTDGAGRRKNGWKTHRQRWFHH